jgi:hypothetical protein
VDGIGATPRTIWIYVGGVKAQLEYEAIILDRHELKKVQLSAKVEVSVNRIPTREELRGLILNAQKKCTT